MDFFRKSARTIALSVVAVVFMIIIYHLGWLNPVNQLVGTVFEPTQVWLYKTTNSINPLYHPEQTAVLAENTHLKQQLGQVIQQNQALRLQLKQYDQYQIVLAFSQDKKLPILPAEIISRVGNNTSLELITINHGETSGIKIGDPVIFGNGLLLGLIYQTQPTYSEVALLTGNIVKLQAMSQADPQTLGLVSGQFGTSLEMTDILKTQTIKVGDTIVTKADGNIPAGLLIGTVQTVLNSPNELFQSATLSPFFQYSENSLVAVITNNS